jgi:hypothetical protein
MPNYDDQWAEDPHQFEVAAELAKLLEENATSSSTSDPYPGPPNGQDIISLIEQGEAPTKERDPRRYGYHRALDPIPNFDNSGNLPPFFFAGGKQYDSPYRIEAEDFSSIFGFSSERRSQIRNFNRFRKHLRKRGLSGTFWIGGSFVSNKAAPKDLDMVLFFRSPVAPFPMRTNKHSHTPLLLNRDQILERFDCDCFYVDLSWDVEKIVYASGLWFGHFCGFTRGFTRGFVQIAL